MPHCLDCNPLILLVRRNSPLRRRKGKESFRGYLRNFPQADRHCATGRTYYLRQAEKDPHYPFLMGKAESQVETMSGRYSGKSIANAFLDLGAADGVTIEPMKIQKLVFFAHGYYLAAHPENAPLINELFEAWQYGPVLPSVYREFREFGKSPITRPALVDRADLGTQVIAPRPKGDRLFDRVSAFVWKTYGRKSGPSLSNLTHTVDGPWDRTRKKARGLINADIPNDEIREHFARLVKPRNEPRPAS